MKATKVKELNNLIIFEATASSKDDEIRAMVKMGVANIQAGGDCMMSFGGFDNDPRELWHIPEAKKIAHRLTLLGACSALTTSTTFDPKWNKAGTSVAGRPFGAFEVWLLAKDMWLQVDAILQDKEALRKVFERFADDMQLSNEAAEAVLNNFVTDGQHRSGAISCA